MAGQESAEVACARAVGGRRLQVRTRAGIVAHDGSGEYRRVVCVHGEGVRCYSKHSLPLRVVV